MSNKGLKTLDELLADPGKCCKCDILERVNEHLSSLVLGLQIECALLREKVAIQEAWDCCEQGQSEGA